MAIAATRVAVKGLFKGSAVLVINGEQVLLKEGKSKHGVKLITATSRDALLEIDGVRQRVGLSSQVGGSYQTPSKKVVRIASQAGNHHWVRGRINGRSIDFLVDTGASLIKMNLSTAKRLGIDYTKGRSSLNSTANGIVESKRITLERVTIGEITLHNVGAAVMLNDALQTVLLGNSFLSRVNMQIDKGVLVLQTK